MTTLVSGRHTKTAYSLTLLGLAVGCLITGVGGCTGSKPQRPEQSKSSDSVEVQPRFTEVSKQVGIGFQHYNGAQGKKHMPETVGSGVAFLDYDNDGWQDILIVNGTNWPGNKASRATQHLYHNNRNGTFTDVTHEAGLDLDLYGMGIAVGDFDNDGWEDIYITAIGPNRLLRNTLGDRGRSGPIFKDVTAGAGVQGTPMPGMEMKWKWSASAAWLDYDKDGKLDLFVCNYVKWSPTLDKWCGHNGIRGYCPPETFEGSYCTLYHNEGGGKFRDVSKETGISGGALGKAFGIGVADYNGDGWPDIAVTNDTWANYLFVNQGGRTFKNVAAESGVASGENGRFKAGMGIDVADWRNNGRFSLLIGNFAGESLSLLEPEADTNSSLLFTDNAQKCGIAEPSLPFLTFGLFFFDYDLDGWQDVFTANGHVDDIISTYDAMLTFKERPLLFHNEHNGTFKEVGVQAGLTEKVLGRGAAFGDFDNDGLLDFALVNNGGSFKLFRNTIASHNRWIRFRAEGTKSNRDGIGALIKVTTSKTTQSRYIRSGGSFLSENQRQITFGLGSDSTAGEVEVKWPSGIVDHAKSLSPDRQYVVIEGQGIHEDPRISSKGVNTK